VLPHQRDASSINPLTTGPNTFVAQRRGKGRL